MSLAINVGSDCFESLELTSVVPWNGSEEMFFALEIKRLTTLLNSALVGGVGQ